MNINHYNPIKSINIEALNAEIASVKCGSGTYEALINDTLAGKVKAVVDNDGTIVSMYYETGKSALEDEIDGRKFSRAYLGKDVMSAVHLGWEMLANKLTIAHIEEDGSYAEVTLSNGDVKTIGYKPRAKADVSRDENLNLPSEVTIEYGELSEEAAANVKAYLRARYGHCLEKGSTENLNYNWGDESVLVSNISWGRALTESEREGWEERV